MHPEMITGEH